MTTLVRPLTRFYLTLRHQIFGRRYRRLLLEEVDGIPLVVLPEVFNPVLFRTGVLLARNIPLAPPGRSRPPKRGGVGEGMGEGGGACVALDMGTGSGIGAIFAARAGWRVVGVDLNPDAVRCARINILLNRLEDRVDTRQGDLFAPVEGERFDLILFNPPFYRGVPEDDLDRAWRGTDVMERFAAGLLTALNPGGRALIVLSTDGDGPGMLAALKANGFQVETVAARDFGNEVLMVYTANRLP
jgi:release factor glutamine methyltransferase